MHRSSARTCLRMKSPGRRRGGNGRNIEQVRRSGSAMGGKDETLTKFQQMKFFSEFGSFLLTLKGMFSKPENGKMYWKEFMHQCNDIGIGSLGIVAIISVFMGAVSTLQTAYQLVSPLIPLSTIAQIVRDTVILEFSPTLVCIVLAGVVGSRIASELGNMRVSEQIDALEIMGINTKAYLIMPKLMASIVVIPMLIVISA